MMNTTKKYLRVNQVAEKLGLSQSTIRKYIQKRKIPYIKIGSAVLFDEQEIEEWAEERKVSME